MENLLSAYQKARKGKSKKTSVIQFEKNLDIELIKLQHQLRTFFYTPHPLRRFIVRDPKTRVIHASAFRDRVVHHALMNIIAPIFEKSFILDSYASQINKGTHVAVQRFEYFQRKVSRNGKRVRIGGGGNSNSVEGYVLKADIKHYFDTVDHDVLLSIIKRKIKDGKVMWLIRKILNNFEGNDLNKGMPLGNYTSQFFANVYLNELDHFVKHDLKVKYYIRYVDDFVILHSNRKVLEYYQDRINHYLQFLKLELHPDKSKIIPLKSGIVFLGYKIFYKYKRLRKRNFRAFENKFSKKLELYRKGEITKEYLEESLQGWFGYAKWANTYKLRTKILDKIEKIKK